MAGFVIAVVFVEFVHEPPGHPGMNKVIAAISQRSSSQFFSTCQVIGKGFGALLGIIALAWVCFHLALLQKGGRRLVRGLTRPVSGGFDYPGCACQHTNNFQFPPAFIGRLSLRHSSKSWCFQLELVQFCGCRQTAPCKMAATSSASTVSFSSRASLRASLGI